MGQNQAKHTVVEKTIYPKAPEVKKPSAEQLEEERKLAQKVKDIFAKKPEAEKEKEKPQPQPYHPSDVPASAKLVQPKATTSNSPMPKFNQATLKAFDTNQPEKHVSQVVLKNWQKVLPSSSTQTAEQYQKSKQKARTRRRTVGR